MEYEYDFLEPKYVAQKARTNKLYCGECKEKIAKGDLILIEVKNNKLKNCFCSVCGQDGIDSILDFQALDDAIGHGQC